MTKTPVEITQEAIELLPCPFCGGEAESIDIHEGENAGGSCVCCKRCLASSNVEFGRKENYISNWNTRSLSTRPSMDGVEAVEAVRDVIWSATGCSDELAIDAAHDVLQALASLPLRSDVGGE